MNNVKEALSNFIGNGEAFCLFFQQACTDGVWYLDLKNPDKDCMSSEFWLLLGYDPKVMEGRHQVWREIIYPDDLKLLEANLANHLADPSFLYDQILRYYHKSGSTVTVRFRGKAFRDPNTDVPLFVLGAQTDLTQLSVSERLIHSLRQQIEALRMSLAAVQSQNTCLKQQNQWLSRRAA